MFRLHGALRLRTDCRRRFVAPEQYAAVSGLRHRPQLTLPARAIQTVFVPRGAEERAVRKALERAGAPARVVPTGIGPRAAAHAATSALAEGLFDTALITGLCGLLSPAFQVGDALVYRTVREAGGQLLELEAGLGDAVARCIPGVQTGIRALASDVIVTSKLEKTALAGRYAVDAVDMESLPLAQRLQRAGVAVAVLRIGSDAVTHDLPDLARALDGSGGVDAFALLLAMLRAPVLAARLAGDGKRALCALQRAVHAVFRT